MGSESQQKSQQEDRSAATIAHMIAEGDLIPVQVFGGSDFDSNGEKVPWGYGLCDRFSDHAPSGSDCNRAAFFLLRPSDGIMDQPIVRAALVSVLDDSDEHLWEQDEKRGHVDAVG